MNYLTVYKKIVTIFLTSCVVIANTVVYIPSFTPTAQAAFNEEINYQGKLADSTGAIVPDGSYDVRYKLYTTSTGGSPIWSETECYSPDNGATCNGTGSDNRTVMTNGLFSTLLGAISSLSAVNFDQTLYLGVEIGGTGTSPTWDGEMTPRKKLGAVPAAFVADNAHNLNGLTSSQFLRSDVANSDAIFNTVTVASIIATSTATSTFGGGINISSGCYAVNGTCIAGSGSTYGNNDVNSLINASSTIVKTNATPTLGQVLVGNALGGYTLTATSSLGFVDTSFSSTSAAYFLSLNQGNAFSTTSANYYANASTTIAKTYTANAYTANQTFNNGLTVGNLNGPLQANNGVVSATSSVGVLYGGTGLAVGPTFGQILVGNSLGGYTLTATSSLGFVDTSFSSTSAAYFLSLNQGNAFSTTSANYFLAQNNLFSTTSSAYFLLQNQGNAFSTTSANYYANASTTIAKTYTNNTYTGLETLNGGLTVASLNGPLQANNGIVSATSSVGVLYGGTGLASAPTFGQILVGTAGGSYVLTATSSLGFVDTSFSSTSAAYFLSLNQGNAFSTTSALYFLSQNGSGNAFSTTSASYFLSLNQGNAFSTTSANYYANASTTIAKTYSANAFTAANTFGGLTTLNGGLTLGSLTGPLQAINGVVSATSTLAAAFGGTGISSYSKGDVLYGNSSGSLSALPAGSDGLVLKLVGGVPTWQSDLTSSGGGGATAFSTSSDSLVIYPTNTTNTLVIGSNATTSLGNIFEVVGNAKIGGTATIGSLSVGSLNGPLQANNGVVSATSSVGVLYGGTGLSTAPAYGQLLLGNAAGGYTLTSTSSLGVTSQWSNNGSSIYYNSGNVSIGTTSSPSNALTVLSTTQPQFRLAYDTANYETTSVDANGGVTLAANGNNGGFILSTPQPAATGGASAGTNATTSLLVVGATGGNSSGSSGGNGTAGNGGAISLVAGDGGIETNGSNTSDFGGNGGVISISGGNGALTNISGPSFGYGGAGGTVNISGGNGGIASNSTSNTSGAGGLLNFKGGTGGDAGSSFDFPGSGGPVVLAGGNGGSGPFYGARGGDIGIFGGTGGNGGALILGGGTRSGGNAFIAGGTPGTVPSAVAGDVYLGATSTTATQGNVYFGSKQGIFNTSTGFLGIGTTTPGSLLSIGNTNGINFSTATSTFNSTGGINLASGCFAVGGVCLTSNAYGDANVNSLINASSTIVKANTAPTFGQILVGTAGGSYVLTSTSSLGFVDTSFSTTSAAYFLSLNQGNAFSTTSANYYENASTTIPKTYSNNTYTGTETLNGGLTVGTLNGPLQANNGVVSATSSVGVLYGGTGLTTAPTFGQVLIGNALGGYTLSATSSLGINSFSTTSVAYFLSLNQGNAFSTTSASYFLTQNQTNAFSTSSASYFLAANQGAAFSTTSANYYENASTTIPKTYSNNTYTGIETLNGGLTVGTLNGPLQANNGVVSATTSVGVLYGGTGLSVAPTFGQILVGNALGGYTLTSTSSLGINSFSTTSAAYFLSLNQGNAFSTTSANYFADASSTIAKAYSANTFTNSNTFNGASAFNGSLTVGSLNGPLQANNGVVSATSSVGVLYGGTGLSVAPTFGQILVGTAGGTYSLTSTSSLGISSFSTTSAAYFLSLNQGNAFSTTSANYYTNASTTIAKTYTNNIYTGLETLNGGLTVGTLNGPLQANNGVVSATSSVGVLYGGTGLASAPTFGQILVGNALGGYTLTATSSLGLGVTNSGTAGQFPYYAANGTTLTATSTLFLSTGGNIGIGTTSPASKLDVENGYLTMNGGTTASEQVKYADRLGVTIPVPYVSPTTASSPIAYDIGPTSGATDFSGIGVAWEDICDAISTCTSTGNTNYESLRMGIHQDGTAFVGSAAGGTGTIHSLTLQQGGGQVGIGTAPYNHGGLLDVTKNSTYSSEAAGMTIQTGTDAQPELLQGVDSTAGFAYVQSASRNTSFTGSILELQPNGGNVGIGTTTAGTLLSIGTTNGINFSTATSTFSSTGGINIIKGCFAVNGACLAASSFSTTSASYFLTLNQGNAFSTTSANYYTNASTTIPKTYTANTYTGLETLNGGLTIGSLTGLLQATNGVVSASSSPTVTTITTTSTTATSTFGYSINLNSGCYAINGNCLTSGSGTVNAASAGQLAFYSTGGNAVSGTSQVTLNGTNVGIGTTTSNWALEVAATRPFFTLSDTSAAANLKNWFQSSQGGSFYIGTTSDSYATSTISALTINSNGYVGIGTTSPYAQLAVNGVIAGASFNADNANATSTFAGGLNVGNNGLVYDYSSGVTSAAALRTGNINFDTDAGVVSWTDMPVDSSAAAGVPESYSANINGNSLLTVFAQSDGSGGIKNSGVGIGSTTPGSIFAIGSTNGINFSTATSTFSSTGGINLTNGCFAINGVCLSNIGGGGGGSYFTNSGSDTFLNTGSLLQAPAFNATDSTATSTFEGDATIGSGGSTALVVDYTGNVGIATSSPWRTLDVNGSVGFAGLTTSSGLQTANLCLSADNEVISDSGSCITSSGRFKQDINSLDGGLDEVMQLNPVSFFYKPSFNGALQSNPNFNGEQVGFIAEDVQKIDPRLVEVETSTTTVDGVQYGPGVPHTVRYENITALLAKAIQQQQVEIQTLYGSTTATSSLRLGGTASSTAITASSTGAVASSTITNVYVSGGTSGSGITADQVAAIASSTSASVFTSLAPSLASSTASSTAAAVADTLASSTPGFIARIANAVVDYIKAAGNWVFDNIYAKSATIDRIQTQVAAVSEGIEMTDQATGQVYCVGIKNGDWNKQLGACGTVATSTQQTQAASTTTPVPMPILLPISPNTGISTPDGTSTSIIATTTTMITPGDVPATGSDASSTPVTVTTPSADQTTGDASSTPAAAPVPASTDSGSSDAAASSTTP